MKIEINLQTMINDLRNDYEVLKSDIVELVSDFTDKITNYNQYQNFNGIDNLECEIFENGNWEHYIGTIHKIEYLETKFIQWDLEKLIKE